LLLVLSPFVEMLHCTCSGTKRSCIAVERVRENIRQVGITSSRVEINLKRKISSIRTYSRVTQKSRATNFLFNIEYPVIFVPLCTMQLCKKAPSLTACTPTRHWSQRFTDMCVCYKVLDRSCFRGYYNSNRRTTGRRGSLRCRGFSCERNQVSWKKQHVWRQRGNRPIGSPIAPFVRKCDRTGHAFLMRICGLTDDGRIVWPKRVVGQ